MNCEICGALVKPVRMQDGSRVEVYLWPLPYRESENGQVEYILASGVRVQATPCRGRDCDGIGYREHKHSKDETPIFEKEGP